MQSGLHQLGVDLANTDFFITHLHADHFALLSKLANSFKPGVFNRPETELMASDAFPRLATAWGTHAYMKLTRRSLWQEIIF